MAGKLRITLRKGTVGTTRQARGTVRALGLRRIGQAVELPDSPVTRGMVRAVAHLVVSEAVAERAQAPTDRRKRASRSKSGSTKDGEKGQ